MDPVFASVIIVSLIVAPTALITLAAIAVGATVVAVRALSVLGQVTNKRRRLQRRPQSTRQAKYYYP